MKLEEKNIIVKRRYKTVYKCDDSVVKVFAHTHPKADIFNEALLTARIECSCTVKKQATENNR